MENVIIREAFPDDAEKFIEYLKRIGGETENLTFGAEGLPVTAEQERAYLKNVQEDKHSVIYCAWRGEELIGDASISALPRRMSHRAELGVSVVKAEWGKGVGSALMEKLISYARNCGIELLNLEVRSDNKRAIALYEKYGFKHIGISPAFLKTDGQYVDCELMYLDLR